MHFILLGGCSEDSWTYGSWKVHLNSERQLKEIDTNIKQLNNFLPIDFNRKPTELKEGLKRYKATQFRTILLYYGMIIFRKYLPEKIFDHYMLLSVAIRLLLDDESVSDIDIVNYAG